MNWTYVALSTLSYLSSHSVESPDPELPDTTLFVIVFFRNFQADISAKTCRLVLRPYTVRGLIY